MKALKWLHLTDLHLGMSNQSYLLPRFKQNLFEDLKKTHDLSGPWDVVFFTGDLTQKGKNDEFIDFTVFLKEIWTLKINICLIDINVICYSKFIHCAYCLYGGLQKTIGNDISGILMV